MFLRERFCFNIKEPKHWKVVDGFRHSDEKVMVVLVVNFVVQFNLSLCAET